METLEHYQNQLHHFRTLFGVEVEGLACDLHPDYLSTQVAQQLSRELNVPLLPVQHHHAHAAAVAAEYGIDGPYAGLTLDGVGLDLSAVPDDVICGIADKLLDCRDEALKEGAGGAP